jgi:hypothetical protein
MTTVGVPSALAVVMLYLLLKAFTTWRAVPIVLALAYGLATLAFPYSTLFYGHQLTAALLLSGFALLARAKSDTAHSPQPGFLMTVGLLLGYAVVVEYPSALALIPILAYAATVVRPWHRLGWLIAGGLVAAIPLIAYHWVVFGGPLTLPYAYSTQLPRHVGFMGLRPASADVLEAILLREYRGLFYSAPWLLLAIPGAIILLGRRGRRAEALVCVVISLSFVWLNSSLLDWQGGWAMGPRYLIPAIPFLTVLVVGLAPRSRLRGSVSRVTALVGAGLALVLMATSALLMLVGTAVKPEVPMDIQRPFADYLLPSFGRGSLAISTQGINAKWPAMGERQAWNVGQLAGLDGLMSLVPLGLYIAATGAWLAWTVCQYTEGDAAKRPLGWREHISPRECPAAPQG